MTNKLLFILAVVFVICCQRVSAQNKLFRLIDTKGDTAWVNYHQITDTSFMDITVKQKQKQVFNKSLFIIKTGTTLNPVFQYIEHEQLKPLYAHKSSYFVDKKGGIKKLYPKMLEEREAFIYNGKSRYECLNIYRLQKNLNSGVLKFSYNPKFGILSLFVNNGEEEVDATLSAHFNLITIDGQTKKEYIRQICEKGN